MSIEADSFNKTILDYVQKNMPWRPFKIKTLNWMRNHIDSPESHDWFKDSNNFLSASGNHDGGDVVSFSLKETIKNWIAEFQKINPFVLSALEFIFNFLINHLPEIINLLLVLTPKNMKFEG
jgi:hypothetical protein